MRRRSKYYRTVIAIPRDYFVEKICECPMDSEMQEGIVRHSNDLEIVVGFGENIIIVSHDVQGEFFVRQGG